MFRGIDSLDYDLQIINIFRRIVYVLSAVLDSSTYTLRITEIILSH